MTSTPAKTWVATLNNWTEDEYKAIMAFIPEECLRAVVGKETGESGTPHLQMAFTFNKNKRLSACRKLIDRAHWEKSKARGNEAFDYCKKEDKEAFCFGPDQEEQRPGPGGRSDLKRIRTMVSEGHCLLDIMNDPETTYQGWRAAQMLLQHGGAMRPHAPREVFWYYGATGLGKTRSAVMEWPEAYFVEMDKGKPLWWDGYMNQDTIILDDWRPDQLSFNQLMRITDAYTRRVPIKGSTVWGNWNRVVITAPWSLDDYLYDWEESGDQMRRRVDHIVKFVKDGDKTRHEIEK